MLTFTHQLKCICLNLKKYLYLPISLNVDVKLSYFESVKLVRAYGHCFGTGLGKLCEQFLCSPPGPQRKRKLIWMNIKCTFTRVVGVARDKITTLFRPAVVKVAHHCFKNLISQTPNYPQLLIEKDLISNRGHQHFPCSHHLVGTLCMTCVRHNATDYTQEATHHAILQSRVNTEIIATIWATISI